MSEWPSIVEAVATAVGVAVVAIGGIFAWLQLRGLKQQTGLAGPAQLFQEFRSEVQRAARRLIYRKMPQNGGLDHIDEELQTAAERVIVSLNGIGFLVHKGLIPMDRALAQLIGPPVIRMWDRLEKFVKLERGRRKENTYMRFFEELFRKCQRELPDYKPEYFQRTEIDG